MAEAEYVITGLRSQMRDLQSVVNYLESREAITGEDYRFIAGRMQALAERLESLGQFSRRCSAVLRAECRN